MDTACYCRHSKQKMYVQCFVDVLAKRTDGVEGEWKIYGRMLVTRSSDSLTRLLIDIDAVTRAWTADGDDGQQAAELTKCIVLWMNGVGDKETLGRFDR